MNRTKQTKGPTRLTGRQEAFVEYYCGEANWNGAKAARLAGYAESSARITAAKLLTKANISEAVKKRQLAIAAKCEITKATETVRFREIGQEAEQAGQYSAAVRAEEQICKLHGLFEADNKQKAAANLAVALGAMLRAESCRIVDSEVSEASRIAPVKRQSPNRTLVDPTRPFALRPAISRDS